MKATILITLFLTIVSFSVHGAIHKMGHIKRNVSDVNTDNLQFNRPQIDSTFEILDVKKVKEKAISIGRTTDTGNYNNKGKIISIGISYEYLERTDSSYFYIWGDEISGYCSQKIMNDSYFTLIKCYYPNGNIKSKCVCFNGAIGNNQYHVGTEYKYNKDKKLIYAVNHDLKCKFTIEQVIEYLLEKEKLELPKGYLTTYGPLDGLGLIYEDNRYVWRIFWTVEYAFKDERQIFLILDGDTGDVISRTEEKINRGKDQIKILE